MMKLLSHQTLPNVRKFFIPDPGYTICDTDLDRADLQVVVWEANDEELKTALRMGVDLHILNGIALDNLEAPPIEELVESHPNYPEHKARFKRQRQLAKSFIHGCVTAGHEVLTPNGWVKVEDYDDGTPIMIWDKGALKWEIPSYFHRDIAVDLISFEGESWSQEMTADHRVLYAVDASGFHHVRPACDVPVSARLPKGGIYTPHLVTESCPTFARQVAAYQADGTIDVSGALVFHVAKKRKFERLQKLFPEATFSKWKDGTYGCRVVGWKGAHLKYAGPWLLTWSAEMLDAWLDELPHWDGYFGKTGRVEVMGTSKPHIEWVATIAHLRGKGASLSVMANRPDGRKDLWRVGINNRPSARVKSMTVTRKLVEPTAVFCPKTSSGFFLFRRNGKIGVTGNTNYGGSARTMAAAAACTVHQAELLQARWFAAHPGIKAWHRRVEMALQTSRTVTNKFGYRRVYFDRIEGLLPEALAWIPQSTVALYINRIWDKWVTNVPEIQILLQVHDSLVFQLPTYKFERMIPTLREFASSVVIPYDDPLVIPIGFNYSTKSWGDCK